MSTQVCETQQRHTGFMPPEPRCFATRERIQQSSSAIVVDEFIKTVKATARIASVVGQLNALKAIATELFDSVVELEIVNDPEIPGVRYLSIYVLARGEVRAIADLRREWYRKVHGLLGKNYDLVQDRKSVV